ncbi:MAG: LEPR-XLL domain-containing protein, partial [Betaproteobacteria bacterium]|nr:LEPR-XLL domain-containing protein [Betaproteobacteria bacterium]
MDRKLPRTDGKARDGRSSGTSGDGPLRTPLRTISRLIRGLASPGTPRPPSRPRASVETLEPRLLLSTSPLPQPAFTATLSYSALPTGSLDATLELVDSGGPNLTLQLRSGSDVLASRALDQNLLVAFTGSAFNDHLTVNLNYDDHGGGTVYSPFAVGIAFDGGTDTPLSDDQLTFAASGPKAYSAGGLFVTSTDKVLIQGALSVGGDVDIQAQDHIDLQGAVVSGNDIRIASVKDTTGGLLGTDIQANATTAVNLIGASLTGHDIGIDAESNITLDSKATSLFGGQVKLGAVDANAASSIAFTGSTSIDASGRLAIEAGSHVDTKLDVAPDSSSNDATKDAAAGVTHIGSTATVSVAGSSLLKATGDLSIVSTNTVKAVTGADGSAGSSSGTAAGAALAVSVVSGDTETDIAGTASLQGGTVTLSALSDRTVDTHAKSTQGGASDSGGTNDTQSKQALTDNKAKTSDGSVKFAAAVAVTNVTGNTVLDVSTGGTITSAGLVAGTSSAKLAGPSGSFSTAADGSATSSGATGIGAAVAINTANVTSRAVLSGGTTFSASGVTIEADMLTAQFGAQATSGAGGSNVGVAGALALNVGVTRADALLTGTAHVTFTGTTPLTLKSSDTSADTAKAAAKVDGQGDSVGVGASVAINVADSTSRALFDVGSQFTGATSPITVSALSNNTVTTNATGGAAGGTAITPAAAITIANHDTIAEIDSAAAAAILKSVALSADHTGAATTEAGGAAAGSNLSLGLALSFASVVDTTRALVDRSLTLGGTLNVAASGKQSSTSTAKASAKGGKSDDGTHDGETDQQNAAQRSAGNSVATDHAARDSTAAGATPKAQTADKDGTASGSSSVNVAGALAVNIGEASTQAGIASNRTVSATDAITVHATDDTDVSSVADGTAVTAANNNNNNNNSGVGIGAAISINVADATNRAFIGSGATVSGKGVSVTADTPSAAAQDVFSAQSTSGAGGGSVGVAGSLAINFGKVRTEAQVAGGATVTTTGGGSFVLKAADSTKDDAIAKPQGTAQGDKVGIGASVAVDVADEKTHAWLDSTAAVTSAADLTVSAESKNALNAQAEGGAGGGVGIVPVAAVTVANLDTTAEALGTGAFSATGSVSIGATHAGTATTTATGKATGTDAAIGASVAVGVVTDTTTASLDRSTTAGAGVTVSANSQQSSTSSATASAKGGKDTSSNTDQKGVDNQSAGQRGAGDSVASSRGARTSSSAKSNPSASTANTDSSGQSGSSSISVAGAVAVNVASSTARASTGVNRAITAGGTVAITAKANADATASADGSAVSSGGSVGVGAAVAINVADVTNSASVGSGGAIQSAGLTIEASTGGSEATPEHKLTATAKSGAGSDKVAVAGSFALNVVNVTTTATVPGFASAKFNGGDVRIRADSTTRIDAEAVPDGNGANGGTVGVGASVALNVVNTTTNAVVADQAVLTGTAQNVLIEAAGAHNVKTLAQNGAGAGSSGSGSGVGVGAGVALAIVDHEKNATLGAGTQATDTLNATGTVTLHAAHASAATTQADADAAGGKVGVGASVGIEVLTDNVHASTARNIAAGGDVKVAAETAAGSVNTIKASAQGNKSDGRSADDEANNQVNNNPNNGGDKSLPSFQSNENTANSKGGEQSGGSKSAQVGVAAAVGVSVANVTNAATVGDGLSISSTGGNVTVSGQTDVDATTLATGTAVSLETQTDVGAAVGLTVATVVNSATVGANAHVSGQNVTVAAGELNGGRSEFKTWGLAAGGGKDYGVAGSVAINVINYASSATVGAGAVLSANGALTVSATSNIGLQALAGGAGFGQNAGVGVGVSIGIVNNTTTATIGTAADLEAAGATTVSATASITPLAIPLGDNIPLLPSSVNLTSVAAGLGASTGDAAVAGSFVVNVFTLDTEAVVGQGVTVNGSVASPTSGQDVNVLAMDTTQLITVAGALAGSISSSGAAVGAGVDVGIVNKTTRASVGRGSNVKARGNVKVDAHGGEDITSVAAAVAAGGSGAVGGSVSVYVVNSQELASVDSGTGAASGTSITADGAVSVTAEDPFKDTQVAGNAAIGSDAGVGLSNTTLVHTDVTQALVGDYASVTTHGSAGLQVLATSPEDLVTIAAGGAGGGTAGVAASAVVNILNETTTATIGNGAQITATPPLLSGSTPDVLVQAGDTTNLVGVGGSIGAGGTAGIGAGVSVAKFTKTTQASMGSGVVATVAGDIRVLANAAENLTSVAAAGAAGGTAGIAGAAGILVMDLKTRAFIGDDPSDAIASFGAGDVHASGSIAISADDALDETNVAGSIGVASTVGVGASVGVPVVTKTVESFVGKGAKVTADGKSTLDVHTGGFDVGYVSAPSKPGNVDVANGHRPTAGDAAFGIPDTGSLKNQSGDDYHGDALFSGVRQASLGTQTGFSGLSVTATNRDSVKNYVMSGGAAGVAAVAVAAGVNVFDTTANAYIDDGAIVNADASNAVAGQSVLVGAGNDFYHLEVAGSLAVAAYAGVAPAVGVSAVSLRTLASIGNGALVDARNDVTVNAHATENLLLVSAGIGGGVAGIGGAVSVPVIDDTTQASIGSGATVSAGGDVAVLASDDTDVVVVSGSGGFGVAGIGASVGVLNLTKHTDASIGAGAHVDALGFGTGVSGVLTGTGAGTSTLDTGTAHGVIVQAKATESVTHLAIAAGAGVVGIAGGVAVTLIDSHTSAHIDANALVNRAGNNAGASQQQGVSVRAGNRIDTTSFAGGIAGGVVGLAGAVDVGVVKNDTSAIIHGGADVAAKGSVGVSATHLDHNSGYTFSVGGGLVGLAASVSVWSLGTPLATNYSDNSGRSGDALSGNQGRADQAAANMGGSQTSGVGDLLAGYSQGNQNDTQTDASERAGGIGKSASNSVKTKGPSGTSLRNALSSATVPQGTQAYIEAGATVNAGADIRVDALDRTVAQFMVGGGGAGFVGIGAGVGVLNIADNARASAGGTLSAGGQIRVNGVLNEDAHQLTFAFAGGFVGVGAAVSIMNVKSTDAAYLSDGVTVNDAGAIDIEANSTQTFEAKTFGVQGGAVAIGASFSRIAVGNPNATDTYASIGANAHIGEGGGHVGDITIDAHSVISTEMNVFALAGGIGAGTFNFAFADITPDVGATIGNGSVIHSAGNVKVYAGTDHNADTHVFSLSVGALAAGVSYAKSNISPVIFATVGGDLTADGNISIVAGHEIDPDTLQPINAIAGGGTRGAIASAEAPSIGAITIAASLAEADSTATVTSGLNNGGSLNALGAIALRAQGADVAKSTGTGVSLSLLVGVGLLNSQAKASGTDTASIGTDTHVHAGDLVVRADGLDLASTSDDATNLSGFASIGKSSSTATVAPVISAQVGNGATLDVAGNFTLKATGSADGDAYSHAALASLGGSFGMIEGTSNVTPQVSALVNSSGADPTRVNVGGTIDIEAIQGAPVVLSDGSITSIDTAQNSLTSTLPTGLKTGDRIVYNANGNPAIGGLVSGRNYGIIALSDRTVKLGDPFTATQVNDAMDTITFTSPHGLRTGDTMIYGHSGDASGSIAGLVAGQTYYVRVIDSLTVKLGTSLAQVTTPQTAFDAAQVNSTTDTITIAGNGFTNNEAVTYRGPTIVKFFGSAVNFDDDTIPVPPSPTFNDLQTDDLVRYTATSVNGQPAVALGGLTNGATYYVQRVDDHTIRLSLSSFFGAYFPIDITHVAAADTSLHQLVRVNGANKSDAPIAGLTEGQTYYVKVVDASTFQLAATPGGAAIDLNAASASGTQYLGHEGIDLTGAGITGQHWLETDLSGALIGTQRLVGTGGLSGATDAYGADGISNATGVGPSFALLISGVGGHATVNYNGSASTLLGDGAHVTSGGDLTVNASNFDNAFGKSGVDSGALLAGIGFSSTNLNLGETTQTSVGVGTLVEAGGNVVMTADSRVVGSGAAHAGAGAGGVSVGGAGATVHASPTTTTNLGTNSSVHAKGDITLTASMGAQGSVWGDSAAYAFLGSGGSTNSVWALSGTGDALSGAALATTVNFDDGAAVRSEHTLLVHALVNDTKIDARSEASAVSAFYSDPNADSHTFVNSLALISAKSGATLTGVDQFNAISEHSAIGGLAYANADGGSLFGGPDANAYATQRTLSRILTDAGAAFASKDLHVDTYVTNMSPRADGDASGFTLNPFDQPSFTAHYERGWDRHITMNGNVILLSAPTPKLVVDSNGVITLQQGLTALDQGTRIWVNDISNDGNAGHATLDTGADLAGYDHPFSSQIDGDQGTLIVRHSWETVELTNYSSKDLWVNAIDPIDRTGVATVDIRTEGNQYRFDITHDYGPTAITIADAGGTGRPDVVLNGLIDNPIGTTTVTNVLGDIRNTSTGKVRTNRADFEAGGSIGQPAAFVGVSYLPANPIRLELVQSVGRATDLEATSGGAMLFDIRGLDRDVDTSTFVLNLGTLNAGTDIALTLEPTMVQTQVANAPSGYHVDISEYSAPTLNAALHVTQSYVSHYKPDGGGPVFSAPVSVFGTGSSLEDTDVRIVLLKAGGNISVNANFGSTRIDITGYTDVTGSGHIDVYTNGDIVLTEVDGDMRVGSIVSTIGDVTLTAAAGIVDALGDPQADVTGNHVTLTASAGGIGSFFNDLEIDSAHSAPGMLTAHATTNVYVAELTGSLVVDEVVAGTGDVRLTTRDTVATGEDIVVAAGHLVSALAGAITLDSGDSLLLEGSILALNRLMFAVDYRNADKGVGGSVLLRNTTLKGTSIRMEGDEDADVLDASGQTIAVVAYGYGGNDTITGGEAADQLYGGDGADFISGGGGDDLIVAGTGVGDVLLGGDGNDTIYGSPDGTETFLPWTQQQGLPVVNGPHSGDYIDGGAGNDTIYGQGGADEIIGGAGNDTIDGGAGNDLIVGGTGADVIHGGLGDDTIYGLAPVTFGLTDDNAQDTIYGEWGNDTIVGGGGDDFIDGGFGDDNISAGAGNDIVYGGYGSNTIDGGAGDDQLYGSNDGADVITGGDGNDRIWGYAGNDTLDGGAGNDIIDGGAGDDLITGGAGSDVLIGGAGNDTLYGHSVSGANDDNAVDYLYGDFGTGLNEPGSGNDRLYGQGGNDFLFGEGGDDLIQGTAGFNQVEASGGSSNVIDFGDASDTAAFVAAPATPAPTPVPVDYSDAGAASSLPDGSPQTGRWGDLSGAASGAGLSGGSGLATGPAVAVSGSTRYVAWTDTRSGNPQVLVAAYTAGAWTQLGGSASGDALGAGVSHSIAAAYDASITVDAGGAPIVAWTADHADGTHDIYAARFDSASGSWVALAGSTSGGGISGTGTADAAQVVATSGGPMVVWLDGADGAKSVYARLFTGGSWQAAGTGAASGSGLGGGSAAADVRDLAVTTDGTRVAASWTQVDAGSGLRQVYLKEYAGGAWSALSGSASGAGVSGVADAGLEGTTSFNAQPSVAYFNGRLFVAWQTWSDQGPAVAVASFDTAVSRTLSFVDAIGTSELPSAPTLSAGGGALRLLWVRTPLESQVTDLYAMRFDGAQFVEELPGEAQPGGISVTGGQAHDLAVVTDAAGRSTVVWQDAVNGQPAIYARGMTAKVGQTYVADASTSVQAILDTHALGAGDVIVVEGTHNENVTITAADAGVMLYGAPGANLGGSLTVGAGANNVIVQRLALGTVTVNGANGFVLTESQAGAVTLNGGSGAQLTYNHLSGNVTLNGPVTGALVDHNTIAAARGLDVEAAGNVAATALVFSNNTIVASDTGIVLNAAAQGVIRDNHVYGGTIGLDIAATFSGPISGNSITNAATGIAYDAAAALSGNTVTGASVGVRTTVAGTTNGLGFVAGSGTNHIVGNTTGVVSVGAQFQQLDIDGNQVGVTGSGVLGGTLLDFANVIENNATGVAHYLGVVQYNRFSANGVAIDVTSDMGNQTNGFGIWHNLFYRNTVAGIRITGASDVRIYQNTFYALAGDNIRISGGSSEVEIQGNILWAQGGYDIYVANDSQAGFFSDYNNLYKTASGKLVYWTKDFTDVLDWQADVARFDLHSIGATVVNPDWAKPQFRDIDRNDFRLFDVSAGLRFTSPTVDASNVTIEQSVPPFYTNVVSNPSFENGTTGWSVNSGASISTAAPGAYDGTKFFIPGNVPQGAAEQSIDLVAAGFTAGQLDSGAIDLAFGGRVRTAAEDPRDTGSVALRFLDANGNLIRSQTVNASSAADRWELVSGRVTVPTGARFAVLRFDAERRSGGTDDAWFDSAFVYEVGDAYVPDLGAYGAGTSEAPAQAARQILLRYPDLYTDWEKNAPHTIAWQTVNNTDYSSVRIDLVQDTPEGPKFVANIVAATPDTGQYVWIPSNSGIDFGTKGLRIQVSLVNAPGVIDRGQEAFTVPEDGQNYYVNDGSTTGDVFTTAPGDNRNTGKTPDAPKPNPVNVMRTYSLVAGSVMHVDTGNYPMIDPIAASGSVDVTLVGGPGVGLDEGFTITGPSDPADVARLFPAIPGDRTRALVDLNQADYVTIEHLTLENANRGLYVHNGSSNFNASFITADGMASDGISIDSNTPFGVFDHLVSFNNAGYGVVINGPIRTLSNSVAYGNSKTGFALSGAVGQVTDNTAYNNGDWGFSLSSPGSVVVQRNASYGNRAGITMSSASAGAIIGDTDVSHGNGNLVYNNRDGGIYVSYGGTVAGNTVYGHHANGAWGINAYSGVTVQSNVVYDNTNGVYDYYGGGVSYNRVYDNVNDGISVTNTNVTGNVVYSNGLGLRLNENYNTPITVRNNLIYANTQRGVLIGGPAVTFISNTVYQPLGDAVRLDNASGIGLYDNILASDGGYALAVNANSQTGFASDYNLFVPSATGILGSWQGADRTTLDSWRGASFTDAHSLVADPQFVNPAGADGVLGFVSVAQDGRDDDFHERSANGGFAGGSGLAPVRDATTGLPVMIAPTTLVSVPDLQSPVIDRGRASDDYSNEPAPNGGYINIGAYGNTDQAARSPTQYVTILTPTTGTRVGQGSTFTIEWRSSGFSGNVNIDYTGGGVTGFTTLAADEANDGSYSWTVDAATFVAGTDYQIRISSADSPAVTATTGQFSVLLPIHYYYVNDGSQVGDEYTTAVGSDTNDGLTPDKPKASIRSVLDTYDLNPGDIILVDTGYYLLGTNIPVAAQDSGVTIEGSVGVGHASVLDRGNTNAGTAVFELQGASDVTLSHLSVTGAQTGIWASNTANSDRLTVEDSAIY